MAKKRFSIGEALSEPFRLATRRPFTVFIWGLLSFAPVLLVLPMMGDIWFGDWAAMEDASLFDPATMQDFWRLQAFGQLSNLLQMVIWVVVTAAAFRVVLRPGDAARRPFALGLGMDELRVAVVCLAVFVGLITILVSVGLIGGGVVASVWSMGAAARAWSIGGAIALFLLVTLIGIGRASLMAPASVAEEDFAFESGWRMARGQVVRIILLSLAIWITTLLVALAAYAVIGLLGWGLWMGLGLGRPDGIDAVREMIMTDRRLWVVGAVLAVPLLWLYGLLTAITAAPYASAVRQLTPERAADGLDSSHASDS